jgi:putative phosphoribosyl transferase
MQLTIHQTKVVVQLPGVELKGNLSVPPKSHAMVLFAHGSGSSRNSPRNQMVASYLNQHGISTFLFDLLTTEEDNNYATRFNIELLAQRLKDVTEWIHAQDEYETMRTGYFGASTGAAAALMAARDIPYISAIVSRGGRPDLAMKDIPFIKIPTMFIVGGHDIEVLKLNEKAFAHLKGAKKLEVIPGATHLFEEPHAMEKVAVLAASWFEMHLQSLELHN